ncbi:MAG: SET domain-containing protein-lysine N-methyltransferase [Patescibacteria group bacterium]|jgi:SET domain-containing protein
MESKGMPIKVKKSKIEGKGVFAARDFKQGEAVYFFPTGKIVNSSDIPSIPEREKRYLDKIGDGQFEIIKPPARYVNHSCNPNIVEKDRVAYALRDIRKEEEITIDYDDIAYFEKPFKCRCGSKNCRGFVRGRK